MHGVLLINLGTPSSPEPKDVRTYLKQFLMDPYVIDIPAPARWFLVNALILPKRPITSSEAYKKIWTDRGSPLLFHSLDLVKKVQRALGNSYAVRLGMRYGNPSIESAIDSVIQAGATSLSVLPLYPQFSLAATESSVQELKRVLKSREIRIPCRVLPDFYANSQFIEAFARVGRESLEDFTPDHVIFSFHGLPERHVKKTDPTGNHCLVTDKCCDQITDANRKCYRAQCYQTAHRIAGRMDLMRDRYSVAFQSRLGRTPWIKPYTDVIYEELPKRGVKKVAVICASFVADCLETLEEVQIRGEEQFRAAGGEELRLVPSLNSEDFWSQSVASWIRDRRPEAEEPLHAQA